MTQLVEVADGDESFRDVVRARLELSGYSVCSAATGDEALAKALQRLPDAAVIEVELPGLTGYELCRMLRGSFGEDLPIVFVSARRTEAFDFIGGLVIGASDYLSKPLDPGELVERLRRAMARTPRQLSASGERYEATAALTSRENEILSLLASGLRQDAIAEQLVISPKTVATHIQRILGKLGVHSRAEAVAAVYQERTPTARVGTRPARKVAAAAR